MYTHIFFICLLISLSCYSLAYQLPKHLIDSKIAIETMPTESTSLATYKSFNTLSMFKTICSGIFICYAVLFAYLLYLERKVKLQNSWNTWFRELTANTHLNEQEIVQKLFKSIKGKYHHNSSHFLTPINLLMYEIEQELNFLHSFIFWHSWISKKHLNGFFPQQIKAITFATHGIENLMYLKKLVLKNAGAYISEH